MIFSTRCAAHWERLRHCVLLSASVSFIINMQCLMLVYLPDMTSPHNGCNVKTLQKEVPSVIIRKWGVVLSCLSRLKYSPKQQWNSFWKRNC